jgi:MoxR-like ATPase
MNTIAEIDDLERGFREHGYMAGRPLLTSVFLMLRLGRPLLLEGHAGVGKTETAKVLAGVLGLDLIRLQCHEGLDVNSAVYEWNYQKQLLVMKAQERSGMDAHALERHIFGRDFLLERPLLRAVSHENDPAVLLIDEVDRADEEFEAFLLELLSDFQITIPELGTVKARHRPFVILTSNRVRELSDALKRRCLYHWIEYPEADKELEIVRLKVPDLGEATARQVVALVQSLRRMRLEKPPGVAETLDWAIALLALGRPAVNRAALDATRGCLLKSTADFEQLTVHADELLAAAAAG